MITLIVSLVLAYLIGSIPTSYIFAKTLKGIDIRQYGSGNAGATNTYRVVGKLPGLAVLLIDVFKGVFTVTLLAKLFMRTGVIPVGPETYAIMLGFMAITGHIWTVFLDFKGGKGIAAAAGVLMGMAPKALLIGLIIWIIVFIWKRYVSLASIISAVAIPVIFSVLSYPLVYVIFGSLVCAITVFKHYPNIKRLVRGEERRISFGNK